MVWTLCQSVCWHCNFTLVRILSWKQNGHYTSISFASTWTCYHTLTRLFWWKERMLLFVGCLTSQQHTSVSQGRICSDSFTCCHTEIEVADQTLHLTQSQYTDTGPTSGSTNPITPGAWQSSYWSTNFEVTGMTRLRKNPASSGIRTPDLPLSRRTP